MLNALVLRFGCYFMGCPIPRYNGINVFLFVTLKVSLSVLGS